MTEVQNAITEESKAEGRHDIPYADKANRRIGFNDVALTTGRRMPRSCTR